MPTLQPPLSPGVIIPGQLGPISLTLGYPSTLETALIMSKIGIPSVIHTIRPPPFLSKASAASIIAAAANLAGTYITLTSALVFSSPSVTVLKTGTFLFGNYTICPPLPGVTPSSNIV